MRLPVLVVGVGADGRASLPEAVLRRIDVADALWGSRRLLAHFAAHPAPKTLLQTPLGEQIEQLRARGDGQVVVLASGDPGFFGIAGTLLRHLSPAEVEIVPHVTSLQWAFARAGLDWNEAIFTSAHARPLAEVVGWARRAHKLGILTDTQHTPAMIARTLLAAGIKDCQAIVAENLGLPEERLVDSRLERVALMADCAPLAVLLLVRPEDWRPQPALSLPNDAAYAHRRGLITKAEVRVLSLAMLTLAETDTAWDIGAGSGAMSIDMAGLAWRGHIWAVEADPENVGYLHTNIERFGALNVTVVAGRAPGALEELPPPHAVFVGGSGGELGAILDHVNRAAIPGCRVVLNLATLEHLAEARQRMRELGWSPTVSQVNIARAVPLPQGDQHRDAGPRRPEACGLTRLAPLNPVFIVCGSVPAPTHAGIGTGITP
jgi:precorrin-6Y C5,15-methyltransferase (decarboxylating)